MYGSHRNTPVGAVFWVQECGCPSRFLDTASLCSEQPHQFISQRFANSCSSHPYLNLISSTFSVFASLKEFLGFFLILFSWFRVFFFRELFVYILCLFFYSIVFIIDFNIFWIYSLYRVFVIMCYKYLLPILDMSFH